MIKMTRNITRLKITSDLQIKHELASNKKRYIRTTTPGLAEVKIYLYLILYMAILDKKKTLFNHGKKLIRIYNKTYCDRQNIEYKYIVYETRKQNTIITINY